MDENTKSFLDKLQEIKKENYKIYVNSLNKTIDSNLINFKQQKDLISTVTEGVVGALKFQKHLNDIIIGNTGNDTLLVSDKVGVILQLKNQSSGLFFKVGDALVDLFTNIEKYSNAKYPEDVTFGHDIKVTVGIPTLKDESQVISSAIDALKKDKDEMSKSVGNIYTFEIVKFVKSVTLGDLVVDFSKISIKDRVNIIENLPTSINKEVIEFIQKVKQVDSDILTYSVDGENKVLDIDVAFFDS